jgi:hypothetical protein
MAEIDPNQSFSWDDYEYYNGPIIDLNYDLELDDSEEGLFLPIDLIQNFIFSLPIHNYAMFSDPFCSTTETDFEDGESSDEEGDENGHGEDVVLQGAHGREHVHGWIDVRGQSRFGLADRGHAGHGLAGQGDAGRGGHGRGHGDISGRSDAGRGVHGRGHGNQGSSYSALQAPVTGERLKAFGNGPA